MQHLYRQYDAFLAFDKPFGIRTHRVADGQFGFVEYLNEKLHRKTVNELLVVHRLDKETSGIILFAENKDTAQRLSTLFEQQKVKKTYYFLTDQKIEKTELKVCAHIEKQNEFFVINDSKESNSETNFSFIRNEGSYDLWQAQPKTGKPHQIRLHAQRCGLPILGDSEHGGSPYFRLALHAARIEFTLDHHDYCIESSATRMKSLIEESLLHKRRLLDLPPGECFRVLHDDRQNYRADIFGDRLWIYDYSSEGLSEKINAELIEFAVLNRLTLLVRHMLDRGQGVGGLEKNTLSAENNEPWTAEENGVRFQLKTDSGFSPGLFLDQRENRLWVRQISKQKKVLNLFSYTGAFSVNAALGGASEVCTVDVSKKFLEWSKENFVLNGLDTEKQEFYAQDALIFLKGAAKRNRCWNLIICDPPSFGRSQEAVWKLERDLPELATLLMRCLERNGEILFTCNLERKTRQDIIQLFTKNIKNQKFSIERLPMLSLDHGVTDDIQNLMKGFILKRL